MPLISIVTIVCNGKSHLECTVQSVLEQSYQNKEYIIIDGGSRDGTVEIIQKYDGQIDYWMSEPDDGISDAFNKGLASAFGDWILFLNSGDTFWDEKTLNKMASHFREGRIITGFAKYGFTTVPYRALNNSDPIWARATISHQASAVHRSIYDEFGGFDKSFRMRMDYDFWLRVLSSRSFYFVKEIFINYAEGGASNRNVRRFYLEEMRANKKNLGTYSIIHWRKIQNLIFCGIDFFKSKCCRTCLQDINDV